MKEVLITSSVLIAALLLLRLIFANRVRRTMLYAVWALVALRLLIPVQIGQMNFSVLTAAQSLTETVTELSGLRVIGQNQREASIQVTKDYIERDQTVFTPQVQEYIRSAQEENRTAEEIAEAIVKTQGVNGYCSQVRPQVQQQVAQQTHFVSVGQFATIVWLIGVAVMAVCLAASNLLMGRSLKKTEIALNCESPIPVYVSEKASSPCLVGLFRPAVYLPAACVADESILRYALVHELTHYAHKDHIWALVRCVCLCVYWFDPLVWVAAWFSRRDCELACDEGAIRRLGEEERIAYGKALLQVVTHTILPGRLMLIATTMAESKKQLKERVNFIIKKPSWSVIAAVCMVLVCALVAGCTAAGPAKSASGQTDPTVSEAPEEEKPYRFAMHDHYNANSGWIQLDADGNAMLYRSETNLMLKEKLQALGMKPSQSLYETVYRYSGTCVAEGDTYTLTVEKVEETYELECADPQALLEAVVEWGGESERTSYEKKFRGEFVEHEQVLLPKVTFHMTDGKLTYLELEWTEDVRDIYHFYPNGNTQTIEETHPGGVYSQMDYYENGNKRSYRQWTDDPGTERYVEQYNEYGHILSSGNYLIDYCTGGKEYEYTYYADGTIQEAWQYSVGEGASNKCLQRYTEYYPDASVKQQSEYNHKGNLHSHYEYDSHGNWTYYSEHNSEGEIYRWGRFEYRYSDAGVLLERKHYENDILRYHHEYYDIGVIKIYRSYHDNGQLSIYEEYDEQGKTLFSQRYDPDGTPWQ